MKKKPPVMRFKKMALRVVTMCLSSVMIFLFGFLSTIATAQSDSYFSKTIFARKGDLKQSWNSAFKGGKICFGDNLEWYVLGRLTNGSLPESFALDESFDPKSNTLVLYLTKGIENINFNDELYESGEYWVRPSGTEGEGKYVNSWAHSDIRKFLNNNLFESRYMTNYEKNLILASEIETNEFYNGKLLVPAPADNKYYLPSAIWNTEYLSWGAEDISDAIPSDASESEYPRTISQALDSKYLIPVKYFAKGSSNSSLLTTWTRSAHSNSKKASLVASNQAGSGLILARNVDGSIDAPSNNSHPSESDLTDASPACAPICRLNIENLSFASYASMFTANNTLTQIPENNGLYLKNKASENDFKGHFITRNNGILTYSSESETELNSYLCLLLKDASGKDYSVSYPLVRGTSHDVDISNYTSGYYWFEKEAESGSRNVIASEPIDIKDISEKLGGINIPKTGDQSVINIFAAISVLVFSLAAYYFSKKLGGKKYE